MSDVISDLDYQKWLLSPTAKRVLLVELQHSDGWEYVANLPFISRPTDAHPNRPYRDLIADVANISQRIDAQLSMGDITLVNDGSIDSWAAKCWRGWQVIFKFGDASWPLDDFRILAKQINAGLLSVSSSEIKLGIYDATATLDQPIAREKIADDQLAPLVLGRALGITPVRLNSTDLSYCVSHLPVQNLIVRDGNGPVLSLASTDHTAGKFTLNSYTPRELWCEVECAYSTPLAVISWVAQQYGFNVKAGLQLPNYSLGLHYADEVTGRQILDDVCAAIGGFWLINLLGELDVQVLAEASTTADIELHADDIEFGRINLIRTEEPVKKITLNYAQNHRPLTEVAGSVEDASAVVAERLRTAWHTKNGENNTAKYPLADTVEIETVLREPQDAQTELNRRLSLRSQRREVWELGVFMQPDTDLIGKTVLVNHPKLQHQTGRIISQSLEPARDSATLEVWY